MLLPEAAMQSLRRVAATGLMDTCQRLTFAATDGDRGPGTGAPTYNEGESIACLFQPKATADAQDESEVLQIDAEIWVARTATLNANDRLTITHLHGDEVEEPQTFEIVKGPVLGKTLLEAGLKLVTDGSDLEG